MTLQGICKSSSEARPARLPTCPQCGDMLLAPLLAEHVNARLVHNHWACESCGHTFRDSHEFAAGAFEQAERMIAKKPAAGVIPGRHRVENEG